MLLLFIILGLAFGSFINAAVWRLHEQTEAREKKIGGRKEVPQIFSGRSMCPKCGHQLRAIDLVPVLSWLWLSGRCRYCHQSISVQYPIIEVLTAGLFGWSYLAWDFNGILSYVNLGFWLLILTGLIILAAYDLRWRILPNRIIVSLLGIALINLAIVSLVTKSMGALGSHILAALLAGLFFYGLYWLGHGRWMGGGDVKVALLIGLTLGSGPTLVGMFLAFNLAAVYSIIMLAARRLKRKDAIPFGPFLIAGTFIAKLYGHQLFSAYIDWFTPY